MLIEDWPVERIRPYPNNPRVLRNAAEKVAESIRAFGWRQPIVVDEDGVVIIGHSRLAAAQLLKQATAPVHVARGLAPEKVRALRIADNKTSEFAGWDDQRLADELQAVMAGLGDVALTGFSRAEFDAIEMQARAELDRITGAQAGTAAGRGPEPEDDDEDFDLPPGDVAGPEEDEAPDAGAGRDPEPPPPADLLPFNALMPADSRQVLYDAISQAKAKHGLQQTADALLVIARSYLNA